MLIKFAQITPKEFTMKQRSWLKSELTASILPADPSPSSCSVCLLGLCFFLRRVCMLEGWRVDTFMFHPL